MGVPSVSHTFLHSGDLGDIIFSLPTIKKLGGGTLYLNPAGESNLAHYPLQTKFSKSSALQLIPLLRQQPYITDVQLWQGEAIDFNLDKFRQHIKFNNLALSHLDAFKLDFSNATEPWLAKPKLRELPKRFVINRSVRYHGNYVEWVRILRAIAKDSIFVGLPKEHEIFEYTFEMKVQYYPTPEITDVLETIASCEKVFCNHSFPQALAEGLAHPLHCETFRPYPGAIFKNKQTSTYF